VIFRPPTFVTMDLHIVVVFIIIMPVVTSLSSSSTSTEASISTDTPQNIVSSPLSLTSSSSLSSPTSSSLKTSEMLEGSTVKVDNNDDVDSDSVVDGNREDASPAVEFLIYSNNNKHGAFWQVEIHGNNVKVNTNSSAGISVNGRPVMVDSVASTGLPVDTPILNVSEKRDLPEKIKNDKMEISTGFSFQTFITIFVTLMIVLTNCTILMVAAHTDAFQVRPIPPSDDTFGQTLPP